jgi:two-component system, sensor histidine kinase and response regulator
LTAEATPEQARHCLEAGMDGSLAKPVRLADLRAMLERCLKDADPDSNQSRPSKPA